MEDEQLEISFDINTIDHLGVKLYSTIPPMIAELVANAWDADAKHVYINLVDEDNKSITVTDDGTGMSFDDLNKHFLKIGRNRRKETQKSKTNTGRNILGKKGLGKLSVFGIGKTVTITTIQNGIKNQFCMRYDDMKSSKNNIYNPEILFKNVKTTENSGTQIKLESIRRASNFDIDNIIDNLSKRFTIFTDEFQVRVKRNNYEDKLVTNEQYLNKNAQFKWNFPTDYNEEDFNPELFKFAKDKKITGTIYTSKTPLTIDKRGIALFSRGKLVQENSSFHDRGNDNFFQYMSGIVCVDFIDDDNEIDYISTDRKSIAWDFDSNADLIKTKDIIKAIVIETQKKWRSERAKSRENILKEKGVDLDNWMQNLTAAEKPLAKKLGQSIIENDKISTNDATAYLSHIKDMFSFQSFKEFTAQLNSLEALEDEKAIKLLTDWQFIEAKEMAKIADGRLKTIDQFAKYIEQDVSETKVMQKFLEKFPWLLDPKMSSFEREVTYSKYLKENFLEEKIPESNKRIDFLCSNNAGVVHIIELKRPRIKISSEEITQAVGYLTFIKNHYIDSVTEVHAILISNHPEMDSTVNNIYESLRNEGKIFIKSYDDLLAQARWYNKEFIKKYDDLRVLSPKSYI